MSRPHSKASSRRSKPPSQPETVDPVWLAKAIGLTLIVAFVCGYLALCFLFHHGQWQIVLHPARTAAAPASIEGAAFEVVHFAPGSDAIPQLPGWWIPSDPQGRHRDATVLFLPAGDGSLADSMPALGLLHTLGINIFAFDYRGYGQSAKGHPSQLRMTEDADSAWQYLTQSRGVPAERIVLYGTGVGASLATHLAQSHASVPAMIIDSPSGDLLDMVRRDPRSRFVPAGLLFHEEFPLAKPLETLRTPKLLIANAETSSPMAAAFRSAAEPKTSAVIEASGKAPDAQILLQFLDRYLQQSATSAMGVH
jgi:pimeloyl-ACP methyl ester carboxylesterase